MLLTPVSYQYRVFKVLSDCKWHCRNCGYKGIPSKQLAGGGGIQGLQRGTRTRPGLVILSEIRNCSNCGNRGMFDCWDGSFKSATAPSGISETLTNRILAYYNYIDSIEQRKRLPHELVVDHRFPMERYGDIEENNPDDMSEEDIQAKFQLLKKDDSGNHNLLKSRACEECKKTGKRGYPLGIQYFYDGDESWPKDCPLTGEEAKKGCNGCGWYDVNQWRESLNEYLKKRNKGDAE